MQHIQRCRNLAHGRGEIAWRCLHARRAAADGAGINNIRCSGTRPIIAAHAGITFGVGYASATCGFIVAAHRRDAGAGRVIGRGTQHTSFGAGDITNAGRTTAFHITGAARRGIDRRPPIRAACPTVRHAVLSACRFGRMRLTIGEVQLFAASNKVAGSCAKT